MVQPSVQRRHEEAPRGGASDLARDPALLAQCYEELRRIARRLLAGGGDRFLIQPTDLAHEAAIRLINLDRMEFTSRAHLLATAARLTRQAMIDEARRTSRLKRRAPEMLTSLPGVPALVGLEDLHQAVAALAAVSPEHAQIVELRFTLGLTIEEAAEATGLSTRTIKRRWSATRAWLQAWLDAHAEDR